MRYIWYFAGIVILTVVLLVTIIPSWVYAAPAMPWTTFSEMAKASVKINVDRCPQGEVLTAWFAVRDPKSNEITAMYFMAYQSESNRVVFVYDPDPQTDSVARAEVATARVDSATPDLIPSLRWSPLKKGVNDNACTLLFPAGA